jgi:O-antigen ligase
MISLPRHNAAAVRGRPVTHPRVRAVDGLVNSASLSSVGPALPTDHRAADPAQRTTEPMGAAFAVFCVYVFFLFARPQDLVPALEVLSPTISLMMLTLLISVRLWGPETSPFRSRIAKLYLLFFAVMVAGVPFSLHRGLSSKFLFYGYLPDVCFFLLFLLHVNTVARLKRVFAVLMMALLVFSAFGLRHGQFSEGRYEIAGSMHDSNDVAFVVLSLLAFSMGVLFGSFSKFLKLSALVAITSGVLLTLYTGSRGGLVGTATFLSLFLVLPVNRISRATRILIVAAVGVAIFLNADKLNFERFETLKDLDSDYNMTAEDGRFMIWQKGLEILAQRPLTGVGVTRFGEAIGTMRMEQNRTPEWQAAHNSYLQVFAETGVIGGTLFLALIFSTLRTFFSLARQRIPLSKVGIMPGILLVGFAVQVQTATFLSQGYSTFFPLMFATAVSVGRLAARETARR